MNYQTEVHFVGYMFDHMYNLHHLQTHLLYVNLSFSYTAKQTSILPKDYLGMLEYKREHEAKLIQNIILGIGCILFLLI